MISDYEIDEVLELAKHHFRQTQGFHKKFQEKYFLDALHTALHNKQSGTLQGACHRCLGTGYEPIMKEVKE